MIKLLYITNGIKGAAGLERVLSIKASILAESPGYEVHILTLNNKGDKPFYNFSDKIIMHDIEVAGNPVEYFFSYRSGIEKVVENVKPSIISVCDDGMKGFFLPLLLHKPCPMIYERHVSKIVELGDNPGFIKRAMVNAKFRVMNNVAKYFDKFVVLTADNIAEWRLRNIIVISNPLSFYPDEVSTLDNKRVIVVGRHAYQKGYDRLLKIWKQVSLKFPDWELHIYGKSAPGQEIERLSEELNVTGVKFFEPVKNIEEKILQSSVFAFPSRFEGFGMVLTEAMACGVPCVSFDCPCGPSEIIRNGEDGFLVPNGDIDAFAKKLGELLSSHSLRENFGRKARLNSRRYLPETIMPQWDRLFKSLAG